MVSCDEYDRDKLYAELAWLEIYKEIIEHKLYGKSKELYLRDDNLNYSNQVQFDDTDENKYVWAKLEELGYKIGTYYSPKSDSGTEATIYW